MREVTPFRNANELVQAINNGGRFCNALSRLRVQVESKHILMSKDFWENEDNQKQWNESWVLKNNPNGYWLALGHLFKVSYSYHRLIGRIQDKEKVGLVSRILLERTVNPNVQGG